MLPIPRRYAHYVFGILQSGLTSGVAAAIASLPFRQDGQFLSHWIGAWCLAWLMMLPLVMFAAPAIRRIAHWLTREEVRR